MLLPFKIKNKTEIPGETISHQLVATSLRESLRRYEATEELRT